MRENREYSLKVILKNEGGYVNDPHDPGGETNYGITKRTAAAHGYTGSMHTIPMAKVLDIYITSFWNTHFYQADTLDHGLDLSVFDYGVNSGPSRAGSALRTIFAQGGSTVEKIKRYAAARLAFLHHLGTWSRYGGGWGRRVASVEALSVKLNLQHSGKDATQVSTSLNEEAKQAEGDRTKAITKGAGGAVTGGADQTAAPSDTSALDPSGWDLHTLLYIGIGVAAIVVLVYFAHRAYIHHQRALAYKEAAQ